MSAAVDILKPRRVAIVASNPAVSQQTGWPIGFWWSDMVHPYWELIENGYQVEIFSPDGGKLEGDKWSDPRDESTYSAEDLLSLGFISSPEHMKLVENSRPIADLKVDEFDAVLFVGGQGPMYISLMMSACISWRRNSMKPAKFWPSFAMPRVSC